jgi:hypothetical protein
MNSVVLRASGVSYERIHIEAWLRSNRCKQDDLGSARDSFFCSPYTVLLCKSPTFHKRTKPYPHSNPRSSLVAYTMISLQNLLRLQYPMTPTITAAPTRRPAGRCGTGASSPTPACASTSPPAAATSRASPPVRPGGPRTGSRRAASAATSRAPPRRAGDPDMRADMPEPGPVQANKRPGRAMAKPPRIVRAEPAARLQAR